ncbi:GSCOCG00010953001-RA-CDS, partial [Cotesia congregata]
MKFLRIFDENEVLIMERRKEFECNLEIDKVMEICARLCREEIELNNSQVENNNRNEVNAQENPDPYQHLLLDPHSGINEDVSSAIMSKLGAIWKKK